MQGPTMCPLLGAPGGRATPGSGLLGLLEVKLLSRPKNNARKTDLTKAFNYSNTASYGNKLLLV